MRLSRALQKSIPLPRFSTSRLSRRDNMAEQERATFYYSNMFCVAITALPIAYLLKANYWSSPEQENLHFVLTHNEHHIKAPKQLPM
ncbi:hypothetical protein, conserved [Babesia bigemina]|uniref:Uncharacterized protein n=1 Tax=Babesia bigemina TaxID=5866 RepID=A0A061D988_BABBI|nr:hypothetical protein, conserved [Babesia bigemina]CDR96547.1 hypothetical protein, conserved [Babesia bigemina]|eukprot:XP_012768733.1 hypothetical protein, conserved [Babesia bigemina]